MFLGTGISVAVQTQVIGKNAWTWYSVEVRGYALQLHTKGNTDLLEHLYERIL